MQASAHALAVRAQTGLVLAVVALSLAPITILLARRLFPGRNVVFARWGFSHVMGVLIFALVLGGLAHETWPLPKGEMDVQAVLVRNAALMAAIVALIVRFAHKLDPESWRALGLWRGMHARA